MRSDVVAVILAGGRSRRMGGGDKCLMDLAGQPLLAYAIERLSPQVAALVINSNSEPAHFQEFGLPVVADVVGGYAGPLAGVLTGMVWAEIHHPDTPWLVSVAADTPLFPEDLVDRMMAACSEEGADLACASSRGRTHPVFGLWPLALRSSLEQAVAEKGVRKVDRWTADYRRAVVEFVAEEVDPFFNINTPDDLAVAAKVIGRLSG